MDNDDMQSALHKLKSESTDKDFDALCPDEETWDKILDAKLAFLNDGTDPHHAPCVRPEVADSWVKCRDSGLAPDQYPLGMRASRAAFQEAWDRSAQMIDMARPMLGIIDDLNLGNDYLFELIDPSGLSLLQTGNLSLHQFAGERFVFDEQNSGTNAHVLCMRHKKPVMIMGPEHYCFALHGLIACAAPIFNPKNIVLGSLLLTQPISDEPWSSSHQKLLMHAAGLVASLASAVEFQLKFNDSSLQLENAETQYTAAATASEQTEDLLEHAIGIIKESLMVIDNDGIIRQISPEACHLLKTSPSELTGKHFDALFDPETTGSLYSLLSHDEKHHVSIDGIRYTVTANSVSNRNTGKREGTILNFSGPKPIQLGASRDPIGDVAEVTFNEILGSSFQMAKAKKLAERFSDSNENILLIGESGTGKEYFAQAIHNKACPGGTFMSINCAAIPPRLIESELFGYESGSFTGAEKGGKPGKIELADGGTLFLDEIGDMPLELQATLLRVLENKRVMRLGGKSYRQVHFRLVAATNKDLFLMVQQNLFREDLLYRLSVLTINLPTLRERGNDVMFFAQYFLNECQRKSTEGIRRLSPEAEQIISAYSWPGNVRQLKNAILSAYYACDGEIITPENLPTYISTDESDYLEPTPSINILIPSVCTPDEKSDSDLPTLSLQILEETAIKSAFAQSGNNVSAAAKLLGLSRATLYRKLKDLDLQ